MSSQCNPTVQDIDPSAVFDISNTLDEDESEALVVPQLQVPKRQKTDVLETTMNAPMPTSTKPPMLQAIHTMSSQPTVMVTFPIVAENRQKEPQQTVAPKTVAASTSTGRLPSMPPIPDETIRCYMSHLLLDPEFEGGVV